MSTPRSDPAAAAGQISAAAAEVYESFFVPALFDRWVQPMLDAVRPSPGDSVLDIGTGTGVVARTALRRVSPGGRVIAVDPNAGMLAVAARLAPGLDIRPGVAESLPVRDAEIDCVTCQFAMMFVANGPAAVREIARTTRPGGRIAVATWAAVEESPGYRAMVDVLGEELGDWAANELRAPFGIGTADQLGDLLRTEFPAVRVERRAGQATFRSLDEWLQCDIRGWTLADRVDDEQFARLRHRAQREFAQFVGADGRVRFAAPALIATATR